MGSNVLQVPVNRMTNLHCYTSCSDSQRIRGVQSIIAQNLKSSIYSRQKACEISVRYSHYNTPNKNEQKHDKYIISLQQSNEINIINLLTDKEQSKGRWRSCLSQLLPRTFTGMRFSTYGIS